MSILYSASLSRRIDALIERTIGNGSTLAFYTGEPPESADDAPTGNKILVRDLEPDELAEMRARSYGAEPPMPKDARYWRLTDAAGLTLMQGDGR